MKLALSLPPIQTFEICLSCKESLYLELPPALIKYHRKVQQVNLLKQVALDRAGSDLTADVDRHIFRPKGSRAGLHTNSTSFHYSPV